MTGFKSAEDQLRPKGNGQGIDPDRPSPHQSASWQRLLLATPLASPAEAERWRRRWRWRHASVARILKPSGHVCVAGLGGAAREAAEGGGGRNYNRRQQRVHLNL
jgi:hypothetical protein